MIELCSKGLRLGGRKSEEGKSGGNGEMERTQEEEEMKEGTVKKGEELMRRRRNEIRGMEVGRDGDEHQES